MQKLDKIDINSLTIMELETFLVGNKIQRYRAAQIFRWLHKHDAVDFETMHNLPNDLLNLLQTKCKISQLRTKQKLVSRDQTTKYLFSLEDETTIETVLIPEGSRNTVCVSSQVGCNMGCTFCATGTQGFTRNLTAGEIAGQVEIIENLHGNVTNVVFMGMGEPLNNYVPLMKSISILNHTEGIALGMRRFTISTCGIVPKIRQLAHEGDQLGLAVSLHASNDKKRQEIMPIAKVYNLSQLISACKYYIDQTKRRITFEYALIAGFNDSIEDCRELASLLQGLICHVNVIPVNPVNKEYLRPDKHQIEEFIRCLNKNRISASLRKERGTDIEAACGQLKQSIEEDCRGHS